MSLDIESIARSLAPRSSALPARRAPSVVRALPSSRAGEAFETRARESQPASQTIIIIIARESQSQNRFARRCAGLFHES